MSTYKHIYCPYCKKNITPLMGERSEFFFYEKYIGLHYNRCPNCNKIYSTNKKLYYQMSKEEQNKIKILYPINILSTIITLSAFISIIAFFIFSIILQEKVGNYIFFIFIIPLIPCSIIGFLVANKNYKEMTQLKINDFEIDSELKKINE